MQSYSALNRVNQCRCSHTWGDHYRHNGANGCYGSTSGLKCPCSRWRGQLTTLKKISTTEYRNRLTSVSHRPSIMCWEAVFETFGVSYIPEPGKGKHAGEIAHALTTQGYLVQRNWLRDVMPAVTQDSAYTLAHFTATHLAGDWLVFTASHVIALRDGFITDTVGASKTVARRIESVYSVIRVDKPRQGNPYCAVIKWLESNEGTTWSHHTHRYIEHAARGLGGTMLASLKVEIHEDGSLGDTGLRMHWETSQISPIMKCDCADVAVFGHWPHCRLSETKKVTT
jgi:hypothetical protein